MDSDRLLLPLACLPEAPLSEQLSAAAGAGFQRISLWGTHLETALGSGESLQSIAGMIADHGLRLDVFEALSAWALGRDEALAEAELFAERAAALGAKTLVAAPMVREFRDPERVGELLRASWRIASRSGIRLALEPLPWSPLGDAAAALDFLDSAGCAEVSLVIDSWHWHRTGADRAGLVAAQGRVALVQISDALSEPLDDVIVETMHRRLLPGEGVCDISGLLEALGVAEASYPVAIEVLSDEIRACSPADAADILMHHLKSVT